MTRAPSIHTHPRDVLFVLPPDFSAPEAHLTFRFPPLGPAMVAACLAPLGLESRAVDLAAACARGGLGGLDAAALVDPTLVAKHLAGAQDSRIDAVLERLLAQLSAHDAARADLIAVSIDRGSQVPVAAALVCAMKARFDKRIIVGGVAVEHVRRMLLENGAFGADIITNASTPPQIRRVFGALLDLPEHRRGPPIEPNTDIVELVRGGLRKAPSPADWPLPDFSIYDLSLYRRDPLGAESKVYPGYRGELGASLALPYFFSFECQFSCAFCQTGGTQEHKPVESAVRELALLSERFQTREFLFFDTQINLLAPDFSRALLAARLDLRWSDSYRVRPSEPGDLALMARAGCVGLTLGVESASARVLKSMVKGHRPEQATETILEAHRNEILVRVNLLSGFPGETRAEFEETRDWLAEHAHAIDDIAPSAFYLTADSPIGRKPERYGIRLRGPRKLEGDGKFRKSPDSLTYDEIDGLSWEERAPLLDESEEALRRAWLGGRASFEGIGGFSPSMMLALRRHFSTKAEIYDFLKAARGGALAQAEVAPKHPEPERPLASVVPKLVAPRSLQPALVRAFVAAFRRAAPLLAARLRPGSAAHAAIFTDGTALVFRGTVTRGEGGRARSYDVEERLDHAIDPSPSARLVEVITFRVEPGQTPPPAEAPPPPPPQEPKSPKGGRTVFLRERALGLHFDETITSAGGISAAARALLDDELRRGPIGDLQIYFENPCDQACEFCEEPRLRERAEFLPVASLLRQTQEGGRDIVSRGVVSALASALASLAPRAPLTITGHDVSRHPRFPELLAALAEGPARPLRFQGPLRGFSSPELVRRVAALPGLEWVATTIQSHDPAEHDAMIGRTGAHAALLVALDHLKNASIRVILTLVLTRRALATLPETLVWLSKQNLAVSLQAFIPDKAMGDVGDKLAPLDELRSALERAPPEATQIIESLVGVPACAAPPRLRPQIVPAFRTSERDDEAFGAACASCAARERCAGVPAGYLRALGARGLTPLP